MREKDITQPVIDKCEQIAELWRMEIKERDVLYDKNIGMDVLCKDEDESFYFNDHPTRFIPIPSISDCLEKLRELDIESFGQIYENRETTLHPLWDYVKGGVASIQRLHSSLLSALLGVLRDKEK